ncbi:MAG: hypothetical protein KY455_02890 [Euryarchaeota archaeon]|nr:hypothetical protein [Euryarchaeota archaeon]
MVFDLALMIPIIAILTTGFVIVAVIHYRTERAKAEAQAGGDYRRLAEEAVRSQRIVLEEVQRMNATLKEIERLLREV